MVRNIPHLLGHMTVTEYVWNSTITIVDSLHKHIEITKRDIFFIVIYTEYAY